MNNLLINYEMPKQKKLHDDVLKERNIEGLRIKEYHNGNFIEKSNAKIVQEEIQKIWKYDIWIDRVRAE